MIYKKEYFIVECNDCGEGYSGSPDCGFTVYDSYQEALDAICIDDWTQHRDGSVFCSVCSPAHPEPGCIKCGCTDDDCSQCVAATGEACHWVGPRKCSRCFDEDGKPKESEAELSVCDGCDKEIDTDCEGVICMECSKLLCMECQPCQDCEESEAAK